MFIVADLASLTERLLMGRKESNQTNKTNLDAHWRLLVLGHFHGAYEQMHQFISFVHCQGHSLLKIECTQWWARGLCIYANNSKEIAFANNVE